MVSIPNSFKKFQQTALFNIAPDTSVQNVCIDPQSQAYDALRFECGGKIYLFRSAKQTPKKQGHFVTLYKRLPSGVIAPFAHNDGIDCVVVAIDAPQGQGFFEFDVQTLVKRGIFSTETQAGKRALRVYASWIVPTAKQALHTQRWQSACFKSHATYAQDDRGNRG